MSQTKTARFNMLFRGHCNRKMDAADPGADRHGCPHAAAETLRGFGQPLFPVYDLLRARDGARSRFFLEHLVRHKSDGVVDAGDGHLGRAFRGAVAAVSRETDR